MSRQRTQPTTIVTTPIRAAGAPPRKTIASTSDRKLPEIFTAAEVVAAEMSLTIEKASSEAKQGEIPVRAVRVSTASATAPASAAISNRTMNGLGRRRPCRGGPPGETA